METREELGYRFEMEKVGNKNAVRATITCLKNGRVETKLFRSKLYSNEHQATSWFEQKINVYRLAQEIAGDKCENS